MRAEIVMFKRPPGTLNIDTFRLCVVTLFLPGIFFPSQILPPVASILLSLGDSMGGWLKLHRVPLRHTVEMLANDAEIQLCSNQSTIGDGFQ